MSRLILDHPLLPDAEIRALITAYRTGDNSAAERIIAHNERAIYRIANRYHQTGVCGDVPLEDLMQFGRMGMLRALQGFDIESSNKFLTYAWAWIRMYISRHGKHDGQQIALSYHATQQRGEVGRAISAFRGEYHRDPSRPELMALTGFTDDYLNKIRSNVASLDAPITENRTLADLIPDHESDPATITEDKMVVASLMRKLYTLPKRWQTVIVALYGMDGKAPASMTDISKRLHISTERVRQIKNQAIAEMQKVNY